MKIVNMYRRVALVVCTLVLLLLLFPSPQQAYADGGAPNLAYVVGGSNGISVIDIAQQKVTGTFALGGDPRTVYLSLDGRFLYITQPALGRVTMLSAKTGQTNCFAKNVPGQPSLLAFDPGTNTLYTAGNGAAVVTAIDSTSCAIKQTIKTNGPVYGLAVAVVGSGVSGGTGNQLWVTDATSLEVFTHTGLLTSIPIPGGPQYISIPPGFTAYVTTRQGSVYAVDLATHKLSPPLFSGGSFGPMDYNAFTSEVYIPDMQNKLVDVLSPIDSGTSKFPHEPAYTIRLGVAPQSIAITSDGALGFIALAGGHVAMLDIQGKQIVNTIFVGGNPQFIITGLYPPLIGTTPQQASIWGTVINVAAYVLVVALLIVPIVLFGRYARAGKKKKNMPVSALTGGTASAATSHVDVMNLNTQINPASLRFLTNAISTAETDGAQALVIEINTPGGDIPSMEAMKVAELNSTVPIISYVSPPTAAYAVSAGAFITLAAHIAAMAPGTTIGASSPVTSTGGDIGSTGMKKIESVLVSDMTNIQTRYNRNVTDATKMVTDAASYTDQQAKDKGIIDLQASSLGDLLNQVNGRSVTLASGSTVTLQTAGATLQDINASPIDVRPP